MFTLRFQRIGSVPVDGAADTLDPMARNATVNTLQTFLNKKLGFRFDH